MLGSRLPNVVGLSSHGPIALHDFCSHRWSVVLHFARAGQGIATTELGMFAKLQDEFTARGCALLAVCSDEIEAIEEWIVGVEETQDCKVLFPILADVEEKLAQTMVRVAENGHDIVVFKYSSLFIVGLEGLVEFSMTYPVEIGRNAYEILRVLDSLQLQRHAKVSTVAHWVMSVSDIEAMKSGSGSKAPS